MLWKSLRAEDPNQPSARAIGAHRPTIFATIRPLERDAAARTALDASFEAVVLFCLLGLVLTFAFGATQATAAMQAIAATG